MAAVQAPKRRLKLVRVKRKRDSEAPEDLGERRRHLRQFCHPSSVVLPVRPGCCASSSVPDQVAASNTLTVVEGLEAPGKRAHTSLSSTLAELSLGGQAAAAEGAAQAPIGDGADATAAAPAVRRQRFRRLSTLSAAQLRSIDGDQLASLLAAQQEVAAARRAGVKSSAGGGAGAAAAAAGRAAQQLQAGQAARYEQVQRRRGLAGPAAAGGASVAGAEADPLQQLASVYDLVRRDGSEQGAPAAAAAAGPGAAAAGQQQAQRRPSRAEQAAAQYDEGTLLCNYMPMIREYLASQGRPLPAEGEGPAAASGGQAGSGDDSQQGSDVTAGAAQQAPPSGSQGAGPAGQDSEGDEYVYDIYAALSEDEGGEGREAEEQWWELHASGAAPVVQVRVGWALGAGAAAALQSGSSVRQAGWPWACSQAL